MASASPSLVVSVALEQSLISRSAKLCWSAQRCKLSVSAPSAGPAPSRLRMDVRLLHVLLALSASAQLLVSCCGVATLVATASSIGRSGLITERLGTCCNTRTGRVALKAVNQQATEEKKDNKDSAARQLLGMKGASEETDIWKIRVQLTKPVTWIPLIWGGLLGQRCATGRANGVRTAQHLSPGSPLRFGT